MNIVDYAFILASLKYFTVIFVIGVLGLIFYKMRDDCEYDEEA